MDIGTDETGGFQIPLADEEKAAMISWATGLSPVLAAVVERICELPASTSEHSSIYEDLCRKGRSPTTRRPRHV